MKNRDFDRMLRKKAASERMELTPEAQELFRDAMDDARIHQAGVEAKPSRTRKAGRIALLVSLECILAAVLMFCLMPVRDAPDQDDLPAEALEAIVPITQLEKGPEVDFEARFSMEEIWLDGQFQNETDDIWLVQWSARDEHHLLWLEPGTECLSHAAWDASERKELRWQYHGFRVTARMLHWMDGAYLKPGQEGYEDQQDLIEAAFEADALILAPGEWENGKAGEMELVLPASYQQEHPETEAIDYYLAHGMIEDGWTVCEGEGAAVLEARTWADQPQ